MKFSLTIVSNNGILAVVCTALILGLAARLAAMTVAEKVIMLLWFHRHKIAETVVPASLSATINCQVARFAELTSPLQYSYMQNKSKRYVR